MKAILLLPYLALFLICLGISSCSLFKKKDDNLRREAAQEANNQMTTRQAQQSDNPYGIPQGPNQTTQQQAPEYIPTNNNTREYQPLPEPSYRPEESPAIQAPSYKENHPPQGTVITHKVTKGDTLWGLAQKYHTSIEAIQKSNNLTSTTIRTGQILSIPQ